VRGSAPRVARSEGDRWSLSVTPRRRLSGAFASLPRRRLDVDIGAFASLDESVAVGLPPGFEVSSAPEPRAESSDFGSYFLRTSQRDGRLVFESHLEIAVSRVPSARYEEFRKFCRRVDAAFDQRLIVEATRR